MTSLLTNSSAMTALQTLRGIGGKLQTAEAHVSSGYRVAVAKDNAAYWSIATTMRTDNKALSAVGDALALGAGTVQTAYLGMTSAIDVVDDIKATLVAAREPSVDRSKLNTQLDDLRNSIYSIVDSSTFSGQNWLHRYTDADDVDPEVAASFTRDANGNVAVQTLTYPIKNELGTKHLIDEVYHNGILTNVEFARQIGASTEWVLMNGRQHDIHPVFELSAATTGQDIDEMLSVTEAMLGAMTDAASSLGSLAKRIDSQSAFVSKLQDSITSGVGRLVDADMEEESSRLAALQTQQQLANQSLSIANQGAQNILSLFQ